MKYAEMAGPSGTGFKVARGVATTVTAADTIATGLATVIVAVASYETDIAIGNLLCQAEVGDQSASPVAGSIILKTWQATSVSNPTPIAATVFSKKVSWIAIGT